MKKQTEYILIFIMIAFIIMQAFSELGSNRVVIEGGDLVVSSRKIDELHVEQIREKYQKKYTRHYKDGLYFEDLKKSKEELNAKYNQYLVEKMDTHLKTQKLHDMKYFIKSYVEIVNEDVKKYSKGEISAQDIFENPEETFMRVNVKLYGFVDKEKINKYKEHYKNSYDVKNAVLVIPNLLQDYYDKKGVEYVSYWHTIYDKEVLNKYSIEDLKKEQHIERLLSQVSFPLAQTNEIRDYYDVNEALKEREFEIYGGIYTPEEDKKETEKDIQILKNKYNMDFYQLNRAWYAPKDNPDLFFANLYEERDYFLSTMYQHILNRRIRKILEEKKIGDKIVFLVQVEPDKDRDGNKGTSWHKCNFGEGFDEDKFLKEGYLANTQITFIYLKGKDEELDYEAMRTMYSETAKMLYSKEFDEQNKYTVSGRVLIPHMYFYVYNIDDYGKKVVVDLFKKHSTTERTITVVNQGLAGIWSLKYKTRVETPGFHYLDIFAEKQPYDYFKYAQVYGTYGNVKPAKEYMDSYKIDRTDLSNLYKY